MSELKSLWITHNVWNKQDLIDHYELKTSGSFFDVDTLKFFKSRISSKLHADKEFFYFVTSEKMTEEVLRKFTARSYGPKTGAISIAVGEFQSFVYSIDAHRAIEKLIKKRSKK